MSEPATKRCPQCARDFVPRSYRMVFCATRCSVTSAQAAYAARKKDPAIPLVAVKRNQHATLVDALASRVDASGGPGECWPFKGHRNYRGYGTLTFRGRILIASRVAYEVAVGPIRDGLHVLHSCDNPPCCNPAHLRVGTCQDNSNDKVSRGRQSRGEGHHSAKLTEQDVREIRRRHAAGESGNSLAKHFEVWQGTVWQILAGKRWRSVS